MSKQDRHGDAASHEQAQPQSSRAARRKPFARRVLRLAVIVMVQIVVVLILLEILARLFDPMGISYYPQTARFLDTMIMDEPIGYRHRPGLRGRYYGATVQINDLGLRDRDITLKPTPNEFRILVMGDSIPFGIGVEFEDTIGQVLERLANETAPAGRRYRTVNMGVPSYNTEQELIQLQTLGLKLQPKLVILSYAANDHRPKMWVFDKRRALAADLAQRLYVPSLAFVLNRRIRQRLSGVSGTERADRNAGQSQQMGQIEQGLAQMHQLCRAAGIGFVVVVLGDQGQAQLEFLQQAGQRHGFAVEHIKRDRDDPRWPIKNSDAYRNSPVDPHPNILGSQVFGTMVYERLTTMGLLE